MFVSHKVCEPSILPLIDEVAQEAADDLEDAAWRAGIGWKGEGLGAPVAPDMDGEYGQGAAGGARGLTDWEVVLRSGFASRVGSSVGRAPH